MRRGDGHAVLRVALSLYSFFFYIPTANFWVVPFSSPTQLLRIQAVKTSTRVISLRETRAPRNSTRTMMLATQMTIWMMTMKTRRSTSPSYLSNLSLNCNAIAPVYITPTGYMALTDAIDISSNKS